MRIRHGTITMFHIFIIYFSFIYFYIIQIFFIFYSYLIRIYFTFIKYKNNIYKGDFVNNQRWGIGDLTTDKFHYKGEFKDNKLEGQGQIDFFDEGQRYEGTFSDNKINGKGIYKWKNEWFWEIFL